MIKNLTKLIGEDGHKMVCFLSDKKIGLVGFIAIHRGNLTNPSFGATRIWNYKNEEEALKDVLRLSKLMSYKASLANLKCGGAKGAIYLKDSQQYDKKILLKAYAERVNYLGGRFITGADVGIGREDVVFMRRHSPYMVGVKVDPVRFTGLGLVYSIKECFKAVFGNENIRGKSFAIQGVGKVGREILKFVYPHASKVYISDKDSKLLKKVKAEYPRVKITEPSLIHKAKVDLFSPNALSNTLNKKTIKELRCKIVVGGANNQLEEDSLVETIHKSGVLYAPDYVVNAGGLISVYDEYENKTYSVKRIEKRVEVIKHNMRLILAESKRKRKTPLEVANQIAEDRFNSII